MQWNKQITILCLMAISLQACTQTKESKAMKKIIYVMDPHCGWCFGNSDNITELFSKFNKQIDFELMVGGMWVGQNAPQGGPEFEQFINTHSPRMESTTGAFVSKDFYALAKDSSYIFSSMEPAAAIVLVKELAPERTFPFTKALQKAMFVKGKRLDKLETYIPILEELNIDTFSFKQSWLSESNIQKTNEEIDKARQMASGFPTLVLQDETGVHQLVSGYFNQEKTIQAIDTLLN